MVEISDTKKFVCSYIGRTFPVGHQNDPDLFKDIIGFAILDDPYKDTSEIEGSYVHFSDKDVERRLDEMETYLKENGVSSVTSLPEEFQKLWNITDGQIKFIPELPECKTSDYDHYELNIYYLPLSALEKKVIENITLLDDESQTMELDS